MEEPEYDKVTQASLNGIYVKAQEMDRGHNEVPAPSFAPPGATGDAETHASTHASDAGDAETHASTHASEGEPPAGDSPSSVVCVESGAGDAEIPAGDVESHASTHASDGG